MIPFGFNGISHDTVIVFFVAVIVFKSKGSLGAEGIREDMSQNNILTI